MEADAGKPLSAFGFVTVLESAEHGLFGGYLVLSPLGRPLEFRCSTPVVSTRAQQILYGPTLRPYLLSEVIGQALLLESEISVGVILTDQRDMLPLGLLRPEPVVHVQPSGARRAEEPRGPAQAAGFELAGACVTAADATACSHAALERLLAPLALHVDLCEPFGRIVSALSEAQMAPADCTEAAHGPAAAA